jgi:hypothetical protein
MWMDGWMNTCWLYRVFLLFVFRCVQIWLPTPKIPQPIYITARTAFAIRTLQLPDWRKRHLKLAHLYSHRSHFPSQYCIPFLFSPTSPYFNPNPAMSLFSASDILMLSADIAKSLVQNVGLGSSVAIANHYGLDGPRIKSRWGRGFPYPSRPAPGPTQPPVQWVSGISWGKASEAWRWAPAPSSAEVKGLVELHLYSPLSLPSLFYNEL